MRGNPFLVMIIFSTIILIMDLYSWWGIKKIISGFQSRGHRIILILYWIVPFFIISALIVLLTLQTHLSAGRILPYFHFISGAFIIFYIPKFTQKPYFSMVKNCIKSIIIKCYINFNVLV